MHWIRTNCRILLPSSGPGRLTALSLSLSFSLFLSTPTPLFSPRAATWSLPRIRRYIYKLDEFTCFTARYFLMAPPIDMLPRIPLHGGDLSSQEDYSFQNLTSFSSFSFSFLIVVSRGTRRPEEDDTRVKRVERVETGGWRFGNTTADETQGRPITTVPVHRKGPAC